MKSFNIAKWLLALVLVLLILVPILFLSGNYTSADQTVDSIHATDNDYIFFVVDQGSVPLAATPTLHHYENFSFYFVIVATVSVLLFIYSMWCLTIRHNANVLVEKLPVFLRSELRNTKVFLHPIRSLQAIKDAEYCVTYKYVSYK